MNAWSASRSVASSVLSNARGRRSTWWSQCDTPRRALRFHGTDVASAVYCRQTHLNGGGSYAHRTVGGDRRLRDLGVDWSLCAQSAWGSEDERFYGGLECRRDCLRVTGFC